MKPFVTIPCYVSTHSPRFDERTYTRRNFAGLFVAPRDNKMAVYPIFVAVPDSSGF